MGSRYAVLDDAMEMVTGSEEENEDANQGARSQANINRVVSKHEGKGKKAQTLVEGKKEKEVITLNVSHMNLTDSMKTGGSMGLAERTRVVGPNGEREKRMSFE